MKFQFVKHNADAVPLEKDFYAKAYDLGMTFSQFLENIDPSPAGSELDAYERQLQRFGIRTKYDPKGGMPVATGNYFFQSNYPAARILFPEFLNRVARVAVMDQSNIINEMIAATETLQGTSSFRSFYIDDTQAQRTMSRVAEFGKFPKVAIGWSEKADSVKKYGVELNFSYEFVRRTSLPVLSILISRIMQQARLDEVAMAISALQLGDGSNHAQCGAISSTNLSVYNGAVAVAGTGAMPYKAYLAWLYTFYPGKCTTIISNSDDIAGYMTMPKPTVDPMWYTLLLDKGALGGVPTTPVNWPINARITPVIHADVAANNLIGIDKGAALVAYREAGADLTETDKIIEAQFDRVVISNAIGFGCVFSTARKKLVTNA